MSIILDHLTNSLHTLENVKNNLNQIEKISKFLEKKIKSGKKIFVYGNGGSFADASHFVGELTATYETKSRKPLPFFLLSSNLASLTGWANDFNFNHYVSRELSCLSSKGDVVMILSTSGGNLKNQQSLNLIKLAKNAYRRKVDVISLLGKNGGELKKISNKCLIVDSKNTANIQESQKVICHSICAYLDTKF